MIRICTSLANAGYEVHLTGRRLKDSLPLAEKPYRQKRLRVFFQKGKLAYAEYNVRLFFYLLFKKMDGICAIDLDTILPCYYISKIKGVIRIYDAHELFCEMKEIVTRPKIYAWWKRIEKATVPHFKNGYTVNEPIAAEFHKMYGSNYEVIRSIALQKEPPQDVQREKFILYQGAVNEGRSFETLIPAMKHVNAKLVICGKGNFAEQAMQLAKDNNVSDKVIFKGAIAPQELKHITDSAYIGLTLFENKGLSNYYSLANRFFDYIHSYTPQLCVDYPVYSSINDQYNVAVMISDLSPESIAAKLNDLLLDDAKWQQLHENCKLAAKVLSWQQEEKKLVGFYDKLFKGFTQSI